jgi:hypothetical protein
LLVKGAGAMKRRRWDSTTKSKIVLDGLFGRAVSDICNKYETYTLHLKVG